MARWQPGTRERLQRTALELYAARGFAGVTVAEIAAAAGLTERTFFHYFADKREVLFPEPAEFQQRFLAGLGAGGTDPITMVAGALDGAAVMFDDERRPWSRLRHTVITANQALLERELLKMSALSTALAGGLRERGIPPATAALAADVGVTVFRTAFAAWVADGEERSFAEVQRSVLAELHELVAG